MHDSFKKITIVFKKGLGHTLVNQFKKNYEKMKKLFIKVIYNFFNF